MCDRSQSYVCHDALYGVATMSRLLKIIGLFCNRALLKRWYSAKETYDFMEATTCSKPIVTWCFFQCCSIMQCIAMCCGVLQRVVACCSVFECNKHTHTHKRKIDSRLSSSRLMNNFHKNRLGTIRRLKIIFLFQYIRFPTILGLYCRRDPEK